MKWGYYSIVICILLATGCSDHLLSKMEEPSDEISQLAQSHDVDPMIKHYMQAKQVKGMVVAIIKHNGSVEFHCYGVTDDVHRYPITPDTLFALGSLSKGVTGEVVTQLVNEGRFHWNDTLEMLLPPDTALSDDAKKITLLQLVTHTSGLPRQPMDLLTLENLFGYFSSGENFYHHLDSDNVLSYLSDFSAPSSRQPRYSNLGYAILGYILKYQKVGSIQTMASAYIFQPLDMRNSSFTPTTLASYPLRARGHAGDQPKMIKRGTLTPDWTFSQNMVGTASLYSSARDLIEYARAHVVATKNTRLNKVFSDVTATYYYREIEAANIAWVTDHIGETTITYQVGYIGGYSSYIGFDKRNQNAVVVLQNSFNWNNYIGHTLLKRMSMQ